MVKQKRQSREKQIKSPAKIKVIGVGGAGGSAINRMVDAKIYGVEYIAINTDAQALRAIKGPVKKIRIGKTITKGLGTGMNPELGRAAIEEDINQVKGALNGADMIFITAGLGGGTGSGAAPIVADLANQTRALTVAVVTKPFVFEGSQRKIIAEQSLKKLTHRVDTIVVIPNSRILQVLDKSIPMLEAFDATDEILKQGIHGISDILNVPGVVNIDFADVKTIMQAAGPALLGVGTSSGQGRAVAAAKYAVENPLLDISIKGAKSVLFIVTGASNLKMSEVNDIAKVITERVDRNAKIIFGAVIDENLEDEIKVTLIATGFEGSGDHFFKLNTAVEEPLKITTLEEAPVKMKKDGFSSDKSIPSADKKTQKPGQTLLEDELEVPTFLRKKIL